MIKDTDGKENVKDQTVNTEDMTTFNFGIYWQKTEQI
jgi:hypothetical protein